MKMLEKLTAMRSHGGAVQTHGLDDETLLKFAQKDERLGAVVDAAYVEFLALLDEEPELMALPENELTAAVQNGFVNFYRRSTSFAIMFNFFRRAFYQYFFANTTLIIFN